jgi:hypothetical protein
MNITTPAHFLGVFAWTIIFTLSQYFFLIRCISCKQQILGVIFKSNSPFYIFDWGIEVINIHY